MRQAPKVFQSVFGNRTHEIVEMGEVKKKGSHLDPYRKTLYFLGENVGREPQ